MRAGSTGIHCLDVNGCGRGERKYEQCSVHAQPHLLAQHTSEHPPAVVLTVKSHNLVIPQSLEHRPCRWGGVWVVISGGAGSVGRVFAHTCLFLTHPFPAHAIISSSRTRDLQIVRGHAQVARAGLGVVGDVRERPQPARRRGQRA